MLRSIVALLLALALVLGVTALAYQDRVERLLAVNTLFDEDRIVANFSNMRTLFESRAIPSADAPDPLAEAVAPLPAAVTTPSGETDVAAFLDDAHVTSLVALQGGRIVHEAYFLGTNAGDQRISWSVAKSVLSLAMGRAVADGLVHLDRSVESYVPALAGSAYRGVTVRQALQMSSGVAFNEDYLDFWSDINRMGRTLALGGSMDAFAAGIGERAREPGTARQYVSIDTHVLAMVLRAATGRSLPLYVGETILAPIGVAGSPHYVTDGDGIAFALGGLNLRTRDFARIGQLVLNEGSWGGKEVVPAAWIAASTAPSAPPPVAPDGFGYGYQWWVPEGYGDVALARGVYGQYLWIDRERDVVIAMTGADRGFRESGATEQALEFMDGLARSVAGTAPRPST